MVRCLLLPAVVLVVLGPPLTAQQKPGDQLDRRDRREPAMVTNTGGRTGTADVVMFSRTGDDLFVAGDDKVVSVYKVAAKGIDKIDTVLRWPMWRERRGAIYAMDVSGDGQRVAVGGLGMANSTVAIIERATGNILHLVNLEKEKSRENYYAITAMAFSSNGEQLAIGTGNGHIWIWDFRSVPVHVGQQEPPNGQVYNRIRAIRCSESGTIHSLAESGRLAEWQRSGTTWEGKLVLDLEKRIRTATFSREGRSLAAGELGPAIHVAALDGKNHRRINLPNLQYPRSLGFNETGDRLAIGVGRATVNDGFVMEANDSVHIMDVSGDELREVAKLPHTGRADALALRGKRLAVAGGDNHEVTVWDTDNRDKPLSVSRGHGSGLWGVSLSEDGNYLRFFDQRNPTATDPNQRAAGEPRTYFLSRRRFEEKPPEGTRFLAPLVTADGWTVRADAELPFQWHVVDQAGRRFALPWDRDGDDRPTCFTFLKPVAGRPTRLAVGHYYGFSLFELTTNGPQRTRLYSGHQGQVTALCAAANGEWLVTVSHDQTIAAWSLLDWPTKTALGARFSTRADTVHVDAVDTGSPAWEMGLSVGDEITSVVFHMQPVFESGKLGSPAKAKEVLDAPAPGRELFVALRRGNEDVFRTLSTLRHRPMWCMLPMQNREHVVWMPQGSYYDTTANGHQLVGWVINDPSTTEKPAFYELEKFRKVFRRIDVIEDLLARRSVARALDIAFDGESRPVNFGRIEPPSVSIKLSAPVADKPVTATLKARTRRDHPDLMPHRVELWINDYRARIWEPRGAAFNESFVIDPGILRSGVNRLTVQMYNKRGNRADAQTEIRNPRPVGERNLLGLGVGINDYSATIGGDGKRGLFKNLGGAVSDIQKQAQAWRGQKGKLYQSATVAENVTKEKASRAAVIAELERLAKVAGPDDRLFLFLSGHGDFKEVAIPNRKKPDTAFYFCCPDYDPSRPAETGIDHQTLFDKLADIKCRKIVFLDACHSGEAADNPVLAMTPGGQAPIIIAACDRSESAYEDNPPNNGLFTLAILHALGDGFAEADTDGNGDLSISELFEAAKRRLPHLLQKRKLPPNIQNPQISVLEPDTESIFRK